MDKFLETQKLPILIQGEIENMNRPRNWAGFLAKKNPIPRLTGEFY